jgi:hypothetical protein
MARPSELIAVIAEATGIGVPTVREQARVIRHAGYMTKEKGGRGPGAMTHRDATNLLIAVAGTSVVRESDLPVEHHSMLQSQNGRWKLQFAPIGEMVALKSDHTFGDAIEALLRSASSGSFQKAGGLPALDSRETNWGKIWIKATLFEPSPMANLEIGTWKRDSDGVQVPKLTERKEYRVRFGNEKSPTAIDPPLRLPLMADLHHEHKFSHVTILKVAELLRG